MCCVSKFSLLLNLNFQSKREGVTRPLEVFSDALKIHKSKRHLGHKSELCNELITFKIVFTNSREETQSNGFVLRMLFSFRNI